MPDYIGKCETCERWEHRDGLVDGVCRNCRDIIRRQLMIDHEYNEALGAWLRGLSPSIAPNGRFREIWTPQGRHRIQWPKERTRLARKQRETLADVTGPLILPGRSRSRS